MREKFKKLLILGIALAAASGLFAEDAVVTYVKGKVEVKKGQSWVSVQRGDKIKKSDILNTGFDSEAKIKLIDSVLYIGPVTRISLTELSTTEKKDNVSIFLKTGAVRSKVSHTEAKRVNYTVNTAVAVASCRGTDWIVDDSNVVTCFEGVVAVAPYISEIESSIATTRLSSTDKKESAGVAEDSGITPTSDEGILVQENQTISVSENQTVSPPVNNTVWSINSLASSVSTAATQETVSTDFGAVLLSIDSQNAGIAAKPSVTVRIAFE